MNEQCSAVAAIYPYQTQEVRDLAWACFSPPLLQFAELPGNDPRVTDCLPALSPARQLWLERLDRDADRLIAHLARRPSHRLGLYFEQLWQFFLQEDPELELVAHNLPVHDLGQTLGEFDCVYFCHRRQRHVHLELAVKFYLGLPQGGGFKPTGAWQDWLGPNTRDRLDMKIAHLLNHQVRLTEQAPARERLAALGIGSITSEIALKGYLFQPFKTPLPAPPAYNEHCRWNDWVGRAQLQEFLSTQEAASFFIVPRMRWLSVVDCSNSGERLRERELLDQLDRHFEEDDYPPLVAALDASGWETARFFVTNEHWPRD